MNNSISVRIWFVQIPIKGFLFVAIFTFFTANVYSQTTKPRGGKVLMLNSYHKGYAWSDSIVVGIERILEDKVQEFVVEYMDTKRQFDDAYIEKLTDILAFKHKKHNYDLIIVSDDNALNYILEYKDQIYEGVPVVFCGANYFDTTRLRGYSNITGVSENANFEKNIELIKASHPNCEEIVVVTDMTTTGRIVASRVEELSERRKGEVPKLKLIADVNKRQLIDSVSALPSTSIVLFTFFFRDNGDNYYDFQQGTKLVAEYSSVPVYGTWGFTLTNGIVGGYLVLGSEQGAAAAEIALEILHGASAEDIPVKSVVHLPLVYDYLVLKKYGMQFNDVPKDAVIVNRPFSFYSEYRRQIINVSLAFILLVIVLIVLSVILRRVTRLKKDLKESQHHIRTLVSNVPGVVYRLKWNGVKWKFVLVNDAMTKLTNFSKDFFLSNELTVYSDLVHPDDYEYVQQQIKKAISEDRSWRIYYRLKFPDDNIKWVFETGIQTTSDKDGGRYIDSIILDVTSQKISELQLIESEKRYRGISYKLNSILDNMPALVFYKDDKNNYLYVNKYIADSHKTDKEELIGESMYDLYPYELAKAYHEDDLEVINTQKPKLNIQEKWEAEEGERWLMTSKIPLKNEDGKVIGVIGIALDITERVNAELELAESENKYKNISKQLEIILDNFPGFVAQKNAKNEIVYANKKLADVLNKSKEELKGASTWDLYPKEIAQRYHESDLEVINSLKPNIAFEESWIIEGEERWKLTSKVPIESVEGDETHVIGISVDITERKLAELALKEKNEELQAAEEELRANNDELFELNETLRNSEDKYRNLYVNAQVAILRLDIETRRCLECNELLAQLFGYDSIDETILGFTEEKHYDDLKDRDKIIKALKDKGAVRDFLMKIKTTDNKTKWVMVFAKLNKNRNYFEAGLTDIDYQIKMQEELALHRDNLEKLVKERVGEIDKLNKLLTVSNKELTSANVELKGQKSQLEDLVEELKQTQQQLVQAEKMASIGILTAGIAHEINNPINFISSGLTGLEIVLKEILAWVEGIEKCSLADGCPNYTSRKVEHDEEFLGNVVENIPKLVESMRVGVQRTTEIVKGLRTFSRLDSEAKERADLHEIIESTLVILKNKYKNRIEIHKAFGEIPDVYLYPGKLGQVVLNLLMNAIQAIEDKGEVTIKTWSNKKAGNVYLSIRDTGAGIPENVKQHIFDPFFTTKEVGEGTGLGLSIVHGIIEEHEGSIELVTEEEVGTEFIIKLPLK